MLRSITRALHRVDHALGRLTGVRRVLVELRTPVYQAVLRPVYETLQDLADVDVFFTSESPDRIIPLVGRERFVSHAEAEWRRFDVYLNADPWAAARLRRCARRVNFFHGVAGKYDLDNPAGLPMGFEHYDRVAFINSDRMDRYLAAHVVTPAQARLIGYPKLDRLSRGRIDGTAVRHALGLTGSRPTVIYAPTYSSASSLHLAGEEIVTALDAAGCHVIVKLHDRSLDTDPRYHGGVDWRARMKALEVPGRIVHVEGPDASPFLAAADVMLTDHSSVGFEFLVLDRPLLVYDAPGLTEAARINPHKVDLLRSAAQVVCAPAELGAAVRKALEQPAALSAARRRVAADMFYDPGGATPRAVGLIQELLDQRRLPSLDVAGARAPREEVS